MVNRVYKFDIEEQCRKVIELIKDISPLFIFPDGFYMVSNCKLSANRTIIIDEGGQLEEIHLTGPLSPKFISWFIYNRLGLDNYLKALIYQTEVRLRSIISSEISLDLLDYCKYVEFFIDLAQKEFGVKDDIIASTARREVSLGDGISRAVTFLQNEKNKSLQFLHEWDVEKLLLPVEGKVRAIFENGMLEYRCSHYGKGSVILYKETKRLLKNLEELSRIFLLLALRSVEVKRLKILTILESRIRSGILSTKQYILFLARRLTEQKRIVLPVEVDGIKTELGLRIDGKKLYVFLSTGEYIVREVLDKGKMGSFVYFPPVDICIEMKTEESPSGESVVVPVESPAVIDKYAHPSLQTTKGFRLICLGNLKGYVDRIINAAKDIVKKGGPVEVKGYGLTILSVEQAVKEALVTAFRVMRYGYVPGANPYRTAVSCVGISGVKIINRNDISKYEDSGVEVIDPLSK